MILSLCQFEVYGGSGLVVVYTYHSLLTFLSPLCYPNQRLDGCRASARVVCCCVVYVLSSSVAGSWLVGAGVRQGIGGSCPLLQVFDFLISGKLGSKFTFVRTDIFFKPN